MIAARYLLISIVAGTTLHHFGFSQTQDDVSTMHRIFVVDVSPSMSGEKIETVKSEFRKVVNQFPPSVQFPLTMFTFGEDTTTPIEFTQLADALNAINSLDANRSGTNIPNALFRLADEIKKHPDANVCAFMFTDGENGSDEERLPSALQLIESLFNERKNKNLSNTVVFHRWGNASQFDSQLTASAKSGTFQLLESKGLSLRTVVLQPKVIVDRVTRTPDQKRIIVEGQAFVETIGKSQSELDVLFLPQRSGKRIGTPLRVGSNGKRVPFKFEYAISSSEEKSGRSDLIFQITGPKKFTVGKMIVVPQVSQPNVKVNVDHPEIVFDRRLKFSYQAAKTVPRWKNPELLQAIFDIDITFENEATKDDMHRESTLSIRGLNSCRIVGGPTQVKLKPNAQKSLTVSVATTSKRLDQLDFMVELMVEVTDIPSSIRSLSPKTKLAIDQLTPPPCIDAQLTPVLVGVKKSRWLSVSQSIAEHSAKILIQNNSSYSPSGNFQLAASKMHKARIITSSIESKQHALVVTIQKQASANGVGTPVEIDFVPPNKNPAIRFRMTKSIYYTVPDPKPLPLILSTPRETVSVSDDQVSLDVKIGVSLPVELSLDHRQIPVVLSGDQTVFRTSDTPTAVGQEKMVRLNFQNLGIESFWKDSEKQGTIDARPLNQIPVIPAQMSLTIVSPAPFKRILYRYIAPLLFVLTVAWVIWFGLRRKPFNSRLESIQK